MDHQTSPQLNPIGPAEASARPRKRSSVMLWLVIAVCLAPVFASYVAYYLVRPDTTTNYGELLAPPVALESQSLQTIARAEQESGFVDVLKRLPENDPRLSLDSLDDYRGRWLLVYVGDSDASCGEACQQALYAMRQIRLATGRERSRVERLWVVPRVAGDVGSVPAVPADYTGTYQVLWDPAALQSWPTAPGQTSPSGLWIIDPLGNLILRYPPSPDPAKIKKDLLKLLKASRIG